MRKEQIILKSILDECEKHLDRMNFAYENISHLFTVDTKKISQLKKEEITFIDQFIYRFSKLQDALGQKLFKTVLINLDEEVTNKSSIDIFNRLEQLEIIKDYDKWKLLRDLRNELAHEYEEDESEMAEKLNLLFEKKTDLEKYFLDIKIYTDKILKK
ncbi:MAG: toxin-antitoxin system antitoxin subunit [Ignavibacteriales bacterium CG_4_9_14_3_um_filter_34_10]|nr:MAG: toxin-antitoxin system antitoxin subunit [Ignavibacteriales bacterium CG_4_9_14_3_um_filter_34_10]